MNPKYSESDRFRRKLNKYSDSKIPESKCFLMKACQELFAYDTHEDRRVHSVLEMILTANPFWEWREDEVDEVFEKFVNEELISLHRLQKYRLKVLRALVKDASGSEIYN